MESPPAPCRGGEGDPASGGPEAEVGREEFHGGQVEGIPRHDGRARELGESDLSGQARLRRAKLHDAALHLQPEGVLLAARAEADLRAPCSAQVAERRLREAPGSPWPDSAASTPRPPGSRGAGAARDSPT